MTGISDDIYKTWDLVRHFMVDNLRTSFEVMRLSSSFLTVVHRFDTIIHIPVANSSHTPFWLLITENDGFRRTTQNR